MLRAPADISKICRYTVGAASHFPATRLSSVSVYGSKLAI